MLEGLKVVELATHIAAPAAAGMLADWGADVTKIEWGGGDPMLLELANLMPDRTAPVFHLDNRGKRSIRLDPKSDIGKDVILRLIRRADVYASVTGYGSTGPDAGLPGYDVAAFSRAGLRVPGPLPSARLRAQASRPLTRYPLIGGVSLRIDAPHKGA
jgi:crotonobetainyl-CoA:carnitine CoA-transferase CaiB-like acyl-CoA transferase